ncbi:3 -5 exoribonuclease csl4 [Cystoisospora suis]|uniref:3-5 exoribonuclease csl4 n=1 Tax=Cystoisospora suis TaxID=483139 RepID=A0A2C6L9H7_9APIC|nr:3 -5 exoribonuclease csl4 [Cystoisospora suis]
MVKSCCFGASMATDISLQFVYPLRPSALSSFSQAQMKGCDKPDELRTSSAGTTATGIADGNVRTPGERLGSTAEYTPGSGTYVLKGVVYSSLVGLEQVDSKASPLPVISVISGKTASSPPAVGCFVLAQVTKISQKRVDCNILAVDGLSLAEPFRGFIRSQDIRETEVDTVDVLECYSLGDVLRAKVISLGDGRSYVLSTASAELGVLFSQGKDGGQLQPVTCKLMRCDVTGRLQRKKVAAPIFLS